MVLKINLWFSDCSNVKIWLTSNILSFGVFFSSSNVRRLFCLEVRAIKTITTINSNTHSVKAAADTAAPNSPKGDSEMTQRPYNRVLCRSKQFKRLAHEVKSILFQEHVLFILLGQFQVQVQFCGKRTPPSLKPCHSVRLNKSSTKRNI